MNICNYSICIRNQSFRVYSCEIELRDTMCMCQRMPVCLSHCSPSCTESPRCRRAVQQTCVEQMATHSWMLWLWVKELAQQHPCSTPAPLHHIDAAPDLSCVTYFDPQPEHHLVLRHTDPLLKCFEVEILGGHRSHPSGEKKTARGMTPVDSGQVDPLQTDQTSTVFSFCASFWLLCCWDLMQIRGVSGSAGVLDPK